MSQSNTLSPVLKITANTTLLRSQDKMTCHNTGASGALVVSLPTNSQAGDEFTFLVVAAQSFTVNPTDATDVVILSGTAGTAGHGIVSSTAGNSITLLNLGGGKWFARGSVGSGWAAN